ncbi:MAG TPA: nicotinate-nucleotide--dimethylbenzimidazole phosphoribosyltransferase [Euzebya sp.]|nr:nicotinate-nucleotide--dimethylbenzimidazole phosphoribosyltransferase [Euzebya sp.]
MSQARPGPDRSTASDQPAADRSPPDPRSLQAVADLVTAVQPADQATRAAVMARWDALAKPPGSLGRLESAVGRIAAASGVRTPRITEPTLLVCAADHGVHAQGVSAWPQAITTAMTEVIAGGRAVTSAFARSTGVAVTVLDVGCALEPADTAKLRKARVRAGSADLALGPAMTPAQCVAAVLAGANVAEELITSGTDLLALGDMGIANTTASAALVAACTGLPAAAVTGSGAGADATTVTRKATIVADAVARLPSDAEPMAILAEVGGLEHAALVGAMLQAAARRIPVVLDGVITNAAALVAARMAPAVIDHLTAGHRSAEPGAAAALQALGLDALLDLDLRLGEGSGAVLATSLLQAAVAALHETATIAELSPPG